MEYKKGLKNFSLEDLFSGDVFDPNSLKKPIKNMSFEEYFEQLFAFTSMLQDGYISNDPPKVNEALSNIQIYFVENEKDQQKIHELLCEKETAKILFDLIRINPDSDGIDCNSLIIESHIVDLSFRTLFLFAQNMFFCEDLLKMNFFIHFKKLFNYYTPVAQAFVFYLLIEIITHAPPPVFNALLQSGIADFAFKTLDDPLYFKNERLKLSIFYFLFNFINHPLVNPDDKTVISFSQTLFGCFASSHPSQRSVLLQIYENLCGNYPQIALGFFCQEDTIMTFVRALNSSDDEVINSTLILFITIASALNGDISNLPLFEKICSVIPWDKLLTMFCDSAPWKENFLQLLNSFAVNEGTIGFLLGIFEGIIDKFNDFQFSLRTECFKLLNNVVHKASGIQCLELVKSSFLRVLFDLIELNEAELSKVLCDTFDMLCNKVGSVEGMEIMVAEFNRCDGAEAISGIDEEDRFLQICQFYGINVEN
ncbi:hypothetical protein GPJ56_004911 [Histomonas meleagridis]|uniref:uncharacterized protein n=1 Tax=Histomonas meleagridis TaxID=135588 RepID=UPI003559BC61|nr:hypothetical protein GPJ56_004911 [Histomonas meleagridis]KAH0806299.1 hypothetical protein GO595_000987 [Histomonas meleagridis]